MKTIEEMEQLEAEAFAAFKKELKKSKKNQREVALEVALNYPNFPHQLFAMRLVQLLEKEKGTL